MTDRDFDLRPGNSMPDHRKPIAPNPPRWKPAADPTKIDVPGLDTDASVLDQIEQLEQMITIKLQVRASRSRRDP